MKKISFFALFMLLSLGIEAGKGQISTSGCES